MGKYKCFFITPIGDTGSETRRTADDLMDLILRSAVEPLGFDVDRGDHHSEPGKIDTAVIRAVQDADLCIADISMPNPNVYYEVGRRDEAGKPLILLKAKGSGELPVDVATRRYIEYDLDDRRALVETREQLISFVKPMVEQGFGNGRTATTLSELAEVLNRVERKIDRLEKGTTATSAVPVPAQSTGNENPVDLLKFALQQQNVPMAENAMETLRFRMDTHRWLDQVVENVAVIGSRKAGDILIENAYSFMDSAADFKQKMDYLGCMVTNLTRTDRELDNLALVEELCEMLRKASQNEPNELVTIYNQLNRLYHGIYATTKDKSWLDKAIAVLNEALRIDDKRYFLYYNLALCERRRDVGDDMQNAVAHVLHSIELSGEKLSADYLETACELLHETKDPRLSDYLSMLREASAIKAENFRLRYGLR